MAKSKAAFEGDLRPIHVADRGSTSSMSTSTSSSTPLLRNALLPPPMVLIPQSREDAAASFASFAQGLPVVVKV